MGPGTTRVVLLGQTVVYDSTVTVEATKPVLVTGTPGVKVADLVRVQGQFVTVRVSDWVAV